MKIVAIGGGEIGRPGYPVETTKIDRETIRLTGKKHPRLLFLPTASNDDREYVRVVQKHFGNRFGCHVSSLFLWDKTPKRQMAQKILSADIVYVGGGNTLSMIKRWKEVGVDKILARAARKGIVLAGVSAGAVCWFKYANSDSKKMIDPKADYIRIPCLNFVPLFLCPHFDVERARHASLKKMLKGTKERAVAVDNCAALEIIDDRYRVVTSKPRASAYLCHWKGNKYIKKSLRGVKKFQLLSKLLSQ
ncbi:MAG: peptidase E [bacterium]|nr:peptidase E [bacterium]